MEPSPVRVTCTTDTITVCATKPAGHIDKALVSVDGESPVEMDKSSMKIQLPDKVPGQQYVISVWSESNGMKSTVSSQECFTCKYVVYLHTHLHTIYILGDKSMEY